MNTKSQGFTLIELLVVLVIISILLAYGIPNYQRFVIEAKREEGLNAIMLVAAAQESHNATYLRYTEELAGAGNDGDSLGLGAAEFQTSANYTYEVTDDNGYTITATAIVGSTQENDNFGIDCTVLTLNALGQKGPLGCWQ